MKRAVILTSHFPRQKRRGSIHWISDHLQDTGWHVTFATVGYSQLARLRGDKRLAALHHSPLPGETRLSASLTGLYTLPLAYPVNTGLAPLTALLGALSPFCVRHWRDRLSAALEAADLVICESGAPVLLAPLLSRCAAQAPRIYRVNDDISLLNAAPALLRAEAASHHFTRISLPCPSLSHRFRHPHVTIDHPGIPKARMKVSTADPYRRRDDRIAICAGTSQLDSDALDRIARAKPQWQIHVLGRCRARASRRNLTFHGETDFDTTLAHIAHADIGLAPYRDRPGIEYQRANSNRILLYRHFGLPILGPQRLCHPSLPRLIPYEQIDRCETMPRQPETLPDWSELADSLAQNPEIAPAPEASRSPPSTA
ncbi:hypothetical protein ACFSUD_08535 [Sulfitobacter aestuarii]|uniref:Glucuronosyltransferase GumK N-terminal domain-containing protein n=1 Tax=Sulfitobacter aestuarii TaxID=2161676 RepID=A0ABW5U2E0_9RHOB